MLLVCDQPAVDVRVIQRLIALRETTRKSVVASSYADTLGVPTLFTYSVFQELLSLGDKAGAKSIILRSRERVASLSFPEGQIDIDTLKNWEKLDGGLLSRDDKKMPELRASDVKETSFAGKKFRNVTFVICGALTTAER